MKTPEPAPSAIDVVDACKRFGRVTALDRVSFSVGTGELFFLLGPSGCGKTTMLRILAGLETPDSGTIRFQGADVRERPPHLRGAPMVFQNYALWPHLSVAENVAFGLVERRTPRSEIGPRVADVLRRVGLPDMGERRPGQLSGGQQQRVVLARALVLNPAVVLLDEPLSNLDARLRHEMREELEKLHRETPITFVYVTHDQVEALSLADRMAVMREGRLLALGTPGGLYHRPPNRFCADFLGESNLVPARVSGTEGPYVRIETELGVWRATPAPGIVPPPGAEVTCLVRPENLRPGARAGANGFEATVTSLRLNGATTTAVLRAGERTLKATVLSEFASPLKPGTRHPWAFAHDDAIALTE